MGTEHRRRTMASEGVRARGEPRRSIKALGILAGVLIAVAEGVTIASSQSEPEAEPEIRETLNEYAEAMRALPRGHSPDAIRVRQAEYEHWLGILLPQLDPFAPGALAPEAEGLRTAVVALANGLERWEIAREVARDGLLAARARQDPLGQLRWMLDLVSASDHVLMKSWPANEPILQSIAEIDEALAWVEEAVRRGELEQDASVVSVQAGWMQAKALRLEDARRWVEAAEAHERHAAFLVGLPAEVRTFPASDYADYALARAAINQMRLGDAEAAIGLFDRIDALPVAHRTATFHLGWVGPEAVIHPERYPEPYQETWTRVAHTWLSTRVWNADTPSLVLNLSGKVSNADSDEAVRRSVVAMLERLREDPDGILAAANRQVPPQGRVGLSDSVAQTPLTASILHQLFEHYRRLDERERALEAASEFLDRFPDHPNAASAVWILTEWR